MPNMRLPYEGDVYVSSPYGNRILNGAQNWHSGIDLVGRTSKNIYAPCDGIIVTSTIITDRSNRTWEWGNYIRLDSTDGYQIFLCHLSQRLCYAGQQVKQGELLGVEGQSGYSFGSHLHYEVRKNGKTVNPMTMFNGITNMYAGLTYSNHFNKGEEDMTKDEVLAIIKEYEESKKQKDCPDWATDELAEAVALGITDGTRPMEHAPRYQVAIMVKRIYEKLTKK